MNVPVQTKSEIVSLILSNRRKLLGFGAKRLGLFGSFVRDQQLPGSDIDQIVEFQRGKKSFDNFIGLAYYLEELLRRKVELVTPSSLSPHVKPRIQREIEYISLDG